MDMISPGGAPVGRISFHLGHGGLLLRVHRRELNLGPALFTEFAHPVAELDDGAANEYLARMIVDYSLHRGLPAHWRMLAEYRTPVGFCQIWYPERSADERADRRGQGGVAGQ